MGEDARNIVEIWEIMGPGKYWLVDSKDFSDGGMVNLAAFGALTIDRIGYFIRCGDYATANSPIDCLTGFPVEKIFLANEDPECADWESEGESNGLPLSAKTKRHLPSEGQVVVETQYDFPDEYTGPPYMIRKIWFDNETGQIMRVEMKFKNGKTDIGVFTYTEKQMKIDWTLRSGYLNKMNVNFF